MFKFDKLNIFGRKKENPKICRYCGKEIGTHTEFCFGTYEWEHPENRAKENTISESIRESGDMIKEHIGSHDKEFAGHVIEKLEFIDKNGNMVNITDLLPSGNRLVKLFGGEKTDPAFAYHSHDKTILYFNLRQSGCLFKLFHEIGHAVDIDKKGKPSFRPDLDSLQDMPFFNALFLNSVAKDVSQEERVAWAYALRKIRELAKQGIDLEPGFDYEEFIKESLCSYCATLEDAKGEELPIKIRRKFKT